MVIQLTDEQDAQLGQIFAQGGPPPEVLAREAIDSYLDWRREHIAAVQKGIAEADRGELLEHDDVRARVEQLLAS